MLAERMHLCVGSCHGSFNPATHVSGLFLAAHRTEVAQDEDKNSAHLPLTGLAFHDSHFCINRYP